MVLVILDIVQIMQLVKRLPVLRMIVGKNVVGNADDMNV